MSISRIEQARRYVAKIPPAVAGDGGHPRTFRVACFLRGRGLSFDDAFTVLSEWNEGCQPRWSHRDLQHKLADAWRKVQPTQEDPSYRDTGRRPFVRYPVAPLSKVEFSQDHFAKVTAASPALSWSGWRHWLWMRSPIIPSGVCPGGFLRHLYRVGDRVNVFTDLQTSKPARVVEIREEGTDTLEALRRGQYGVHFLIQPVSGQWHEDGTGKKSCRSQSAVTRWPYMLIETDRIPMIDALRLLSALPLQIASIATSGRRSIHALVRVDLESKEDWDAHVAPLKRPLASLGVDTAALSAVKTSRLPGCWRGETGQPQKLLYLNPDPAEAKLIDLPQLRTREAIL